jgi:antitoxin component of MazEF toxin-antitoxin module
MIVISPTELRAEQKKYLDLAEKQEVVVKRGNKMIHLVVKERLITYEDLARGITAEELIKRVHKRIDGFKDKK